MVTPLNNRNHYDLSQLCTMYLSHFNMYFIIMIMRIKAKVIEGVLQVVHIHSGSLSQFQWKLKVFIVYDDSNSMQGRLTTTIIQWA